MEHRHTHIGLSWLLSRKAHSEGWGSEGHSFDLCATVHWTGARFPHVQSGNDNTCPANLPALHRGSNEIKYVNILENCETLCSQGTAR